MKTTDLVDRASLRDDIPAFAPGDTLKVHVRVVEGNRERTQLFQGVVIRRQGSGLQETFAEAFRIPSASMEPQLDIGDRVVVSRLAYHLHDPRRGDIVVFPCPARAGCAPAPKETTAVHAMHAVMEAVMLREPKPE